ncbi:MAG: metallopeptidase TldD-related protein [Actinomycetota bacterium]
MPGAIGRDAFLEIVGPALELDRVDGVEALLLHSWSANTRFASSQIHQSTAREDTSLRIRIVRDGRIGVAETNEVTRDGAVAAARSAREMTDAVGSDPAFPGLAPVAPIPEPAPLDTTTAEASPAYRAETVAAVVDRCGAGMHAAGAYETGAIELGLANTEGQVCWAPHTQAALNVVVTGPNGGSGFAEAIAPGIDGVDGAAAGARAAEKAGASADPQPIDPGTYEVVLEPAATSTLVDFLGFIGFGGRSLLEGESCLSGKKDTRVAAPSISIVDDATDPGTIGAPFDFEGVPKRKLDLIRDGVFRQGAYDRRTAKQAGTVSTGHGLPAPNPDGPLPLHLCLEPGSSTVEEMIAATERGLLVTRFHYTNVVNAIASTITGMTRDGTFLIENGRVVGPVANLRFTQSILEALRDTSLVGTRAELSGEFFFGVSRVPALKIDRFTFSS